MFSNRILRKALPSLESVAEKNWVISPAENPVTRPAYFLPNQLERVTGWEFSGEHPRRAMEGGVTAHGATRAYLVKNVWLNDGTIYSREARNWLAPRSRWFPGIRVDHEFARGAVMSTVGGIQYFGRWLMDDCSTYLMACDEGMPVTAALHIGAHTLGYEAWLGMKPARLRSVFFRELVFFDDVGQTRHKRHRQRILTEKLLSRVTKHTHPGVFIVRGRTGAARRLHNEWEIADYLRQKRGFRILDPSQADVPTIVATCAGARIVAGIEGSGLSHGARVLEPGSGILALQPPNRFVDVYKHRADLAGVHFGFVVGSLEGDGFRVDPVEVERTLDLFPA